MIWPARNLGIALLVPALASLLLLVPGLARVSRVVLALDLAVALLALADALTLIGARRLRAERKLGSVASLGEAEEVELTLLNPGGRSVAVRVKDDLPAEFEADPEEFLVRVAGRGLVVLAYRFVPNRRGTFILRRVYAAVRSRLGFWQRQVGMPCESIVRVYPDLKQISRYTLLARRDRLSAIGVRRSRRLGTDNEFERLRDYAEGDEPRNIDWRATARRRKVTVRDHQTNQSQRVIFLIDSGRMMAGNTGEGMSPLDHAFNAMLMLAHVALIRGDQVGLMVYSDRVRAFLPPAGGGPKRINRLVHAVHDLFPELVESRHDRAFVELERRCGKRSLLIQISNVFDDVGAQQLLDHLGNLVGKHLPLGVLLRDADLFALADSGADQLAPPATTGHDSLEVLGEPLEGPALYESAAAAAVLNWRERVIHGLRQRRVLTMDVAPEDLTAPLVNKYLELKARHLL
jgi:uncharacterized protein (DUF58 family)